MMATPVAPEPPQVWVSEGPSTTHPDVGQTAHMAGVRETRQGRERGDVTTQHVTPEGAERDAQQGTLRQTQGVATPPKGPFMDKANTKSASINVA